MQTNEHYDLIIIGAGLVGSSLIVALKNQGLKIAVLERHLPQPLTQTEEQTSRPLSLAYGSWKILSHLGLSDALSDHIKPIQNVHVSEQGVMGKVKFSAQEMNVPALGYVIPAAILQRVLYQTAANQEDVDILVSDRLIKINQTTDAIEVQYQHNNKNHTICASLLIGADGTHSTTRELLGVPVKQTTHNERAHIFQVENGNLPATTAIERFTKHGVIAVLPSTYQGRAVVWTLPEEQAIARENWSDSQWLEAFNQHMHTSQSVPCTHMRTLNQYPLTTQTAQQQCGQRWVLIGNAAHAFYPLAAQGFNLGLRDVAELAETLANANAQKKNIGNASIILDYQKNRQSDQRAVQRLTSWLSEGFSIRVPLSNHVRGLSLLAIELCPPLKRRIARRTMGLSLPQSRLARGLDLVKPGVAHD